MMQLLGSYFELCKPRVVALMLLTAIVGMLLASDEMVPLSILVLATLGIGLTAASGGVVNHLVDRKIDAIMRRTHKRPLPSNRITPSTAAIFAAVMGGIGITILAIGVNWLTAVLAFLALVGYGFVYTLFLKRMTPQNIVLGGLAGAMPPMLGWAAVAGSLDYRSFLLVLIIFTWTPPHFWALALGRRQEYEKANIPMLPVTHGNHFTKLSIVLYVILASVITLLPFITQMSGFIYLIGTLLLNAGFLTWAIRLYICKDTGKELKIALKMFHYSNQYLIALFVFLLVDHYFLIRI